MARDLKAQTDRVIQLRRLDADRLPAIDGRYIATKVRHQFFDIGYRRDATEPAQAGFCAYCLGFQDDFRHL